MTAPTIFLNGSTLMTTSTDRVILIARELGYAGIEGREERLVANPDEVRAAAKLAEPGEVFTLNGISLELRADGSMDRQTLETDLAPRLSICKELGSPYLLAVAPRAPNVSTSAAIAGMREALELVAGAAGRDGIRVAFEFLGFPDCPVNTPALAGELVEPLAAVEVVLDSCHWHASGAPTLEQFPVERLALVHLNDAPAMPPLEIEDADRVLPGDGVIALGKLIDDLRARGYSGPWSLETFNPGLWLEDPTDVARRGLSAIERIVRRGS